MQVRWGGSEWEQELVKASLTPLCTHACPGCTHLLHNTAALAEPTFCIAHKPWVYQTSGQHVSHWCTRFLDNTQALVVPTFWMTRQPYIWRLRESTLPFSPSASTVCCGAVPCSRN